MLNSSSINARVNLRRIRPVILGHDTRDLRSTLYARLHNLSYKNTVILSARRAKRKAHIEAERHVSLLSQDLLDYHSRGIHNGSDETTNTSRNEVIEQLPLLRLSQAMRKISGRAVENSPPLLASCHELDEYIQNIHRSTKSAFVA